MSDAQVEFGELVSLLHRIAPRQLDELRNRFPSHSVQLKPGAVLGTASSDVGCSVAQKALADYAPAADDLRLKIRNRLRWSWRFDLLAKFAAACGSGGAVGVLATGVGADKAILASIVALIGSACSLVFSYLQRDETSGSVADSYNKLIAAMVEATSLQSQLEQLCPMGDSAELRAALAQANDTAKSLNELLLRFG
jgi:hypothetical protein